MSQVTIANGRKRTVYDSGTIVDEAYTAPETGTPTPPRVWDRNEFIGLFTPQEWSAAKALAQTDITAGQFMDMLMTAPYIKEDNRYVVPGLSYFYSKDVTARTPGEILAQGTP